MLFRSTIEITPALDDLTFTIPCPEVDLGDLSGITGDVSGEKISGTLFFDLGQSVTHSQGDDGTCQTNLSFNPTISANLEIDCCSEVGIDGGSATGEVTGTTISQGSISFDLSPSQSDSCNISYNPILSAYISVCDDSVVSKIIGSAVTGSVDITLAGQTIGTLDLGGEVTIEDGEGPCVSPIIRVVLSPTWNASGNITTRSVDICEGGEISTVTILVVE